MSQSTCTFDACGREHNARGLCTTHYMQWYKGKPLTPIRVPRVGCDVEGCTEPHKTKGYCLRHYNQFRRWGDPLVLKKRRDGEGCFKDGYKVISVNGVYNIREHRHVMEQRLGRPLLPTENVHHINGDRADNRIENLELWSTSQPCGQRVADKVAWAKEILDLYGGPKVTLTVNKREGSK